MLILGFQVTETTLMKKWGTDNLAGLSQGRFAGSSAAYLILASGLFVGLGADRQVNQSPFKAGSYCWFRFLLHLHIYCK